MKKIFIIILTTLCAIACQKPWESSIELGVNQTRLNIENTNGGEFYYSIFSNTDWTFDVVLGEDWLSTATPSGTGRNSILIEYTINPDDDPRIAKAIITASTGKEITVFFVQKGKTKAAKDVEDDELLLL